jgi:hypothetical protein
MTSPVASVTDALSGNAAACTPLACRRALAAQVRIAAAPAASRDTLGAGAAPLAVAPPSASAAVSAQQPNTDHPHLFRMRGVC